MLINIVSSINIIKVFKLKYTLFELIDNNEEEMCTIYSSSTVAGFFENASLRDSR